MNRTEYDVTAKYMTKDGKPWFPMMGEFHFSRYPRQYWKESIYKMKAGGIEIISTYVFWLHHEEVEKEYEFTGQRDLKAFVETVKECGMTMFLRVGPWCHGEARNGGLPDWLLLKDYEVRTNNPEYLAEVKRFYKKIAEQVEGLYLKDDGPIIGLQIENEYGHCGGMQGEEGEEHMRRLTAIAKEVGMVVPYYTATGWGGAVTGGLIPVMGGYCEAPWDQRLTEIEPSGNYVFTEERNDHNIGSDYGFGTGITYDLNKFPYLTAELGGGLQVTHHRRPVAYPEDIGAMSMVKLGSGVNLLGYYMYHGGTNPKGRLTTLQESKETGYPNDLPVFNYDFFAPIGEYGQVTQTLKELKLLTMFLKDFGSDLCKMSTFIPKSNPLTPTNQKDLRTSVRHNGQSGYLFVNNFQRRYPMNTHKEVAFEADLDGKKIIFPPISIKDKEYYFFPFQMPLGNAVLKTALATPLCILNNSVKTYIFYTNKKNPQYDIEGELEDIKLITLSREEAKNAWKITLDKEHLIISDSCILHTDQGIEVIGRNSVKLMVFPDFTTKPAGLEYVCQEGEFTVYKKEKELSAVSLYHEQIEESKEKKVYDIWLTYPKENIKDCFLKINYGGDSAKLFLNGECIGDHFYTGEVWEVGLKRFSFPEKLRLEIYPLEENAKVFLEQWPTMCNGVACEIYDIGAEIEYVTIL